MKTIPSELSTVKGTQPLFRLLIKWNRVTETTYTRDKIIELGNLTIEKSNIVGFAGGLSVTLDDTDDSIKSVINTVDIHKAPATFQLGAVGTSDYVTLFVGEINGPLSWSEDGRQVSFTIDSKIEDREVGFSLEESRIENIDNEDLGKPWPLCFGHVVHVPATKIHAATTGVLMDQMVIVHPLLVDAIFKVCNAYKQEQYILKFYASVMQSIIYIVPEVDYFLQLYIAAMQRKRELMALRNAILALIQKEKIGEVWRGDWAVIQNLVENQWAVMFGVEEFDIDDWRAAIADPLADKPNAEEILEFLFNKLAGFFEYMRSFLRYLDFYHNIWKDALDNIRESLDNMRELRMEYIELSNEFCRQVNLLQPSVTIEGGSNFPQGTETDIIIDGFRWRGTFDGEEFTFSPSTIAPDLYDDPDMLYKLTDIFSGLDISEWYTPLSIYEDLEVDPWVNENNACGVQDEYTNLDVFYLSDSSVNLAGMYCLVERQYDSDGDGEIQDDEISHHIIKIVEQDGNKCTFELVPYDRHTGSVTSTGRGQRGSNVSLPTYGTPFETFTPVLLVSADDYAQPDQLNDYIIALLLAAGIGSVTDEEKEDLLNIQKALVLDNMITSPVIWVVPTPRDLYTVIGEDITKVLKVAKMPIADWFDWDYPIQRVEIPNELHWEATYGEKVYDATEMYDVYVANLLPSEIKGINAYRKFSNNERVLLPVPSQYYTYNEAEDIGAFTVTSIRFPTPLSQIGEQGWEDKIYVTLNSSVGPNVIDTLEYLIDTYTEYSADSASFTAAKTASRPGGVEAYPANFALFTRKNVMQQLYEIAWQARYQLYLVNDTFYITYLSTEPSAVGTLDTDKINSGSLVLTTNETDSLVTKMDITWREHYLPDSDLNIILRHNVGKYGLHEEEYDWYIYNNKDLIIKSATYWLIQLSNTWKHISCVTPLATLSWDVGDAVTLENTGFATGSVKSLVERVSYNPFQNEIEYVFWLPVKSGELTQYTFAWPADAGSTAIFPMVGEDAGSPGPGHTIVQLPTGLP